MSGHGRILCRNINWRLRKHNMASALNTFVLPFQAWMSTLPHELALCVLVRSGIVRACGAIPQASDIVTRYYFDCLEK